MTSTSGPAKDPGKQQYVGIQWQLTGILVGVLFLGYLLGLATQGWTGQWPVPLKVGAGGLGALALGGYVGLVVSRPLKRRLRQVEQFAGVLARGDFGPRLPIGSFDEIGQLEERLNHMAGEMAAAVARLQALAETNRELAAESGRLAALEERTRLARDLHDTVNQRLFSLALLGAGARRRLAGVEGVPLEVTADLTELEKVARETHTEMRQLILHLRPTSLEQHGLGPALEEYVAQLAEREGLAAAVAVTLPRRLTASVEEHLFRLVQEALNNVVKHARAEHVQVSLGIAEGQLTLRVTDDGVGFDPRLPTAPSAVGLKGMHERAATLGGRLQVGRGEGQTGTAIELTIPWEGVPHD